MYVCMYVYIYIYIYKESLRHMSIDILGLYYYVEITHDGIHKL